MIKDSIVVKSLEDKLNGEKVKCYVYGSDLKVNAIWVWLVLFIFIILVTMFLKNDVAIWICALFGALVGGYTGYNQPTYLAITNRGNLVLSKFKLDNKTPRFVRVMNLDNLNNVDLITNHKSGKNILRFAYKGKRHEYLYMSNIKSKYIKDQKTNATIFNKLVKDNK